MITPSLTRLTDTDIISPETLCGFIRIKRIALIKEGLGLQGSQAHAEWYAAWYGEQVSCPGTAQVTSYTWSALSVLCFPYNYVPGQGGSWWLIKLGLAFWVDLSDRAGHAVRTLRLGISFKMVWMKWTWSWMGWMRDSLSLKPQKSLNSQLNFLNLRNPWSWARWLHFQQTLAV